MPACGRQDEFAGRLAERALEASSDDLGVRNPRSSQPAGSRRSRHGPKEGEDHWSSGRGAVGRPQQRRDEAQILDVVSRSAPAEDLEDAEAEYYLRRSEALRLALVGNPDAALRELDRLWSPRTPAVEMMSDVAWVRLLSGEPDRALRMLSLAVRGVDAIPMVTRRALLGCVHTDRSLSLRAIRIALRTGRVRERVGIAYAVIRTLTSRAH